MEGLFCGRFEVPVYLGFSSSIPRIVELLPLLDFDDFPRLHASKSGLSSLLIRHALARTPFYFCVCDLLF